MPLMQRSIANAAKQPDLSALVPVTGISTERSSLTGSKSNDLHIGNRCSAQSFETAENLCSDTSNIQCADNDKKGRYGLLPGAASAECSKI